jgi:hypothetical protein
VGEPMMVAAIEITSERPRKWSQRSRISYRYSDSIFPLEEMKEKNSSLLFLQSVYFVTENASL